jgi:hypothetical protein
MREVEEYDILVRGILVFGYGFEYELGRASLV